MAAAAIITGVATLGSAVFGAMGQSASNRQQRKAVEQKYEYDRANWKAGKKRIKKDYKYLVKKIEAEERNFDRQREYKDAIARDTYKRELQIANVERQTNALAYTKSELVYANSNALSGLERRYSQEAAYQQRKEIHQAAAFDNEQAIIDSLQAQGAALARGQSGRSAKKAQQVERMNFGRDQAVLAASLLSADTNLHSTLRDINLEYDTAILNAEANRMLPPPPVLDPIKPRPTPDMEFMMPRELGDYDFGPKPIKGVAATTNPWLTFANTALSGAASIASAKIQP